MTFYQPSKREDEVFAHKIRTLSASDLAQVVGGGPFSGDDVGKGISAQDNQGKVMG
jgi:hypothetical protein